MSFDWLDYLQLAEELAGSDTTAELAEARARSAISRAYYAAHHVGRQKAEREGALFGGPEAHQKVIEYFQRPIPAYRTQESLRKQIGANLDKLRRQRNNADYDAALNGTPHIQAQLAIQRTQQIIKMLVEL